MKTLLALSLVLPALAQAQALRRESPRSHALELRFGSYLPLVDADPQLDGRPYEQTFGNSGMLLFEMELDRQLFQRFGSAALGVSLGYGEKFGPAVDAVTGQPAAESTGLRVLPVKLLGVYRFDWAALKYDVPLVPHAKLGLVATPWWVVKGGQIETADGLSGSGVQWGWTGALGLSVMLDWFEPRMARDMDSSSGINHSYLFAEYVHQDINNFGRGGPWLSSRHWMFGLALEY